MAKLIVIALLALIAVLLWRNWSRSRREAYITAFPYQRFLDQRLAARHPGLTAEQRNEVFAALDDYFQFCRKAGRRMVSMPSQAVDDAEVMSTPTQASDGLKRAWRLACAHEKIDPKKPDRLPRLFAIDAALGIAGGFIYQLDCLAATGGAAGSGYCASHIGCGSGGGCSGDASGSDGDGGGGGCGGD